MWLVLVGLAQAADDGMTEWLDLVLLASRQDGTGASVEELKRRAEPLCAAGTKGACDLLRWAAPFDRAAAVKGLSPVCGAGDGVACLVVAWDRMQVRWGDAAVAAPGAAAGFALVEKSCAAGLERACTEVGRAQFDGTGTSMQRSTGKARLGQSCAAGEPAGCRELALRSDGEDRIQWLHEAARLGDPQAHWLLATGGERATRLTTACDAGLGVACRDLARLEPNPLPRLQASCAAQDADSCVEALVGSAEWGGRPVPVVVADLDQLCATKGAGCARADVLRQGAPPITFFKGTWPFPTKDRDRLTSDLLPAVFPCYIDRLGRGDVAGALDVAVHIDPAGNVVAASVRGSITDAELTQCAARRALSVRARVPNDGPMFVTVSLALGHTALAKLQPHPGAVLTAKESDAIAKSLEGLGPSLDACAVGAGHEVDDLSVNVVLPKDGAFDSVTFSHPTQQQEIDACAMAVLLAADLPTLAAKVKGIVSIDFLEPAPPSGPLAASGAPVR